MLGTSASAILGNDFENHPIRTPGASYYAYAVGRWLVCGGAYSRTLSGRDRDGQLVGWEAEIGSWKLRGVIVAETGRAWRTTTWVGSGRLVG